MAVISAVAMDTNEVKFVAQTRHQIALRLLPFLFLLYVTNYIDRSNLAYAVLGMSRDLGFNDRVFGLAVGIFFVTYVVMQIPGALLVERWSARKTIALSLFVWGMLTVLTALVRTPMQLYAARFLLGAAEAGFFPGVVVYLSRWFIREDRAKASGNFMAAIPLSSVIGSPFAGWIMGHSWRTVEGWRWLFILEGMPAVVLAVVAFFYLKDRPSDARWLSEQQKTWLTKKLRSEAAGQGEKLSVTETLRTRVVVLCAASCFFSYFMYYTFLFYFPKMLKAQSGLSDQRIGFLGTLPFLVTFIAMQVNGWHSDLKGERTWHSALPLIVGAVGVMFLMTNPTSTALTVGLFVLVSSATAYLPVFWSIPTESLSGAAASSAVGFINAVGSVAGFAGPYLFGYLKTLTGSYTVGLGTMAFGGFFAALLIVYNGRAAASSRIRLGTNEVRTEAESA